MKLIPWVGGMLVVLALLFSLYVKSVASKAAISLERNASQFQFLEGFKFPEGLTFEDLRGNGSLTFQVLNPEAETVQEKGSTPSEETIEL